MTLAIACHRGYSDQGPEPSTVEGSYEYVAEVQGSEVRGRFLISGGLVVFNVTNGDCPPAKNRHAPYTPGTDFAVYQCTAAAQSVTFLVSLHNPLHGSTWSSTRPEIRYRRVCADRSVDAQGRDICRRYSAEAYEVSVQVGGPLTVRRP